MPKPDSIVGAKRSNTTTATPTRQATSSNEQSHADRAAKNPKPMNRLTPEAREARKCYMVDYSERESSAQAEEQKTMKNDVIFRESKVGFIRGMIARIWQKKHEQRANERRTLSVECYRELMAERDARLLLIPDQR